MGASGKPHTLTVDHRRVLLDLLREDLDLTGAKKGCDHGQCSCVLGGRAARRCLYSRMRLDRL
ncbi:putative xanthine dehydrogenase YagT iron-sulfur-binding subunit [Streptomyces afghaniensis 772] [Streptomyces afghaniensis]